MKFLLPLLVWFVMAGVIAAGIVMAVLGKGLWLLILSAIGFVLLFSKYGCLDNS